MRNSAIVVPSKKRSINAELYTCILFQSSYPFIISSYDYHFFPNTGLDTRRASVHTHKKRNPGLDYRSDGGSRVCYFHRWLFFAASKLVRRHERFLGERGFTTGDTRVDHSLSFSAPSPFCQPCS